MLYLELLIAFVFGGVVAHLLRRRIEAKFAKPEPKKVRKPRTRKAPSVLEPNGE